MADAIGIDIKLNTGDLGYTMTGDLMIVEDLDNIWQVVTLRLTTTLGTYIFATDYGTKLGQFVDEPITTDLENEIMAEAKTTILQDSRITSVSNMQVTQDSGLTLSFSIKTINGSTKSGSVTIGG